MTLMGMLIPGSLANTLGWTLLHSLWQGMIIFVLYRVIAAIIHPSRSKTRYVLSVAALAMIPLSAAITFAMLYPEPNVPSGASSMGDPMNPIARTASALFKSYSGDLIPGQLSIRVWYSTLLSFLNGHMDFIAAGWIAGMLIFLFRMTGGYFYSHRLKSRHVFDVDHTWKKRLEVLRQRMDINCSVRLVESSKVSIPSVIGFLKPVILVPVGVLSQIPADQLEAILVHELAHILRKDYLINLLQVAVEAIFFFHPVVWWLSGRIRAEREFICDDLSLAYCQNPLTYIKALTSIQELSQRPPVFAAALASGDNQLMIRIKRMIKPQTYKLNYSGGSIMLLLTLAIVTVATSAALAIKSDPALSERVSRHLPGSENIHPFSQKQPGNFAFFPGITSPYQKKDTKDSRSTSVVPDTTGKADSIMAERERRMKEQYEKQLQEQEMAQERLQEAHKEHQEAIEQYREAYRQQREFQRQKYHEALREAEKRLQELYLKDSFDKMLPHCILPPGNFYFDFGPGMESFAWPDDSIFYKHFDFFTDSLPEANYYFHDPWGLVPDPEDERFEYPIPYDLKLPDIYYHYPDLEDLPEIEKILPPDAPDLEGKYLMPYQHALQKTETIMKSELLKDGIITREGDYVVFVDSGMMSVNGVKQPREVFKKYKRLLETATGEELKEGLTFFY
jgi:beta-lactamase regulating signal transducer with metallopeptidase domain